MTYLVTYFTRLTGRRQRLLLQALASLLWCELLLRLVAFERLRRWLRLQPCETSFELGAREERTAREIGWAIGTVANRVPWLVKCLTRALAASLLGRWHRLPTTLYLGVLRADEGQLQAHAWSRCGTHIITGGDEQARFTTIACFS